MPLQVWLPLQGDLTNNGLMDINVTGGTPVWLNDGKLGKCISLESRVTFNSPNLQSITNNAFSVAFWERTDTSTTLTGNWVDILSFDDLNTEKSGSGTFRFEACYGSSLRACSWHNNAAYNFTNGSVTVVPDSEKGYWHHICVTIGNGVTSTYRDGELLSASATGVTGGYLQGTFRIGETGAIVGGINDLRIYDHVLSPKEIKLLSQGLVCHYKLDNDARGGQPNLYDFQTIASKWTAENVTLADYPDPVYLNVLKITTNATNKRIYRNVSNIWTSGQKYAVSFLAKASADCTCDMSRSIADFTSTIDLTTEWKRYSGVINCTTTSSTGTLSFRINTANVDVYLTQVKLEYGEVATSYCPDVNDPNYKLLGYDESVVYDSSGHNYHGEPMTTTLSYSSDTPRNLISTHFNGTYDGVIINNLPLSNIINSAVTYSFWIKPESETGARSVYFGSYSSTSWSIEKSTANVLRLYWDGSPDEHCTGATITDGVWQHICITKNGTSDVKVYVNGVQKWASTATHSALAFPTTYRIGRDTRSNDGTPYKGLMSDFRIYATALSAEDVLALYNTPESIANNGTVITQGEFVEV